MLPTSPTTMTISDLSDGDGIPSVRVRAADGIDAVEVRIRWDGRTGPARALALLARAAIEVVVRARKEAPNV